MQSEPSSDLSDISQVFWPSDSLRIDKAISRKPGEKSIAWQGTFSFSRT